MIRHRLWLLVLLSLFTITPAHATTITPATCSQTDVQAAINSAVDGDTIAIPAGTCTWTTTVVVGNVDTHAGKILTIRGAGAGVTIITHLVPPNNATVYPFLSNALSFNTKDGAVSRITGITWQGGGVNDPYNKGMLSILGPASQFRIDNCVFVSNGTHAITTTGYVRGVIDHNTFNVSAASGYGIYIFHTQWLNTGNYGDKSWASPDSFGTAQAMYVENNTFTNDQSHSAFYYANDGWSGGRVVYRYNTYVNTVWSNHGTETSGRSRGQRQYEVYNNTFSFTNGAGVASIIGSRGGTGIVYNNSATLTGGAFINHMMDMSYFRVTDHSRTYIFGYCDGTNAWDGNSDSTGYRCLDQSGAGPGDYISGDTPTPGNTHQILSPVYAWNNTVNGVVQNLNSNAPTVIILNRDYYNIPKPGYTAFTYPHPLIGTPPPPTPVPVGIGFSPTSLQIQNNTASGTAFTTFTVTMSDNSTFTGTTTLTANPSSTASIVGSTLQTARSLTGTDNGVLTFTVQATQNGTSVNGNFSLTVAIPVPSSVAFAPTSPSLQEDALSGAFVSNITVTTSNGTPFTGALSITANPGTTVALSGNTLVLARNLVHADIGTLGPFTVRATQNGVFVSQNVSITVTAIAPPPTPVPISIGFTPTSLSIQDNTASGTVLTTFVVTMNDGSTFSGTTSLTANPGSIVSIVGSTLKTARGLTVADDGPKTITLQATQNAVSVTQNFVLTITTTPSLPPPPTPVAMTLSPSPTTLPDNALAGDVVSTVSVTTSDGSAFSGTLTLTANPGTVVALVGNQVVLNRNLTPADDGTLGPFTVQATENSVSVSNNVSITVVYAPPRAPSNLQVQ